LPALGESVTEGTVTRWLKQVGDRVEVDEPLLEVSTDKVDTLQQKRLKRVECYEPGITSNGVDDQWSYEPSENL
jgi:hypothetical protein